MFKHNITYVDFNGNERSEDFYFHLSTPEVLRIEAKYGQSIEQYTKEIAAQQDLKQLLEFMEEIVLTSYGRKTTDGKSFIKNEELRREFEYSQAYAELFEELLTNHDLAAKFGEGVAESAKNRKQRREESGLKVVDGQDSDK